MIKQVSTQMYVYKKRKAVNKPPPQKKKISTINAKIIQDADRTKGGLSMIKQRSTQMYVYEKQMSCIPAVQKIRK